MVATILISMIIIMFVSVMIVIASGFSKGLKNSKPINTDDTFSQAEVVVNFHDKIIKIKGKKYPVSSIRGLRWESGHGHGNILAAFIKTDDIENPVHIIQFIKPNDAEAFVERLSLALEKADGVGFN